MNEEYVGEMLTTDELIYEVEILENLQKIAPTGGTTTVLSRAQYAVFLEMELEKLELRWRTWLEDTIGSEMPAGLLDDLWVRGLRFSKGWVKSARHPHKYQLVIEQYDRDVFFAHQIIEMAKDPSYPWLPYGPVFVSDFRKHCEETYAFSVSPDILDHLWSKNELEYLGESETTKTIGYILNVQFVNSAIDGAQQTGYLPVA